MSPQTPDDGSPLGLGPQATAPRRRRRNRPAPLIDPRPYRMMIGGLAVVLLVAFSVYRLTTHQRGTIGVPAGARLRWFAAPLAGSGLIGDANVNPPCTSRQHDPRALNVCLLAQRGPVVLAFFVTGSAACEHAVGAVQTVSSRLRASGAQFAAVAVRTGPAQAAAAVRSHRWTIPVAYDRDGAVGALYGVAVCPLVEVARRGGIVAGRLIGDRWTAGATLAARVQDLLAG